MEERSEADDGEAAGKVAVFSMIRLYVEGSREQQGARGDTDRQAQGRPIAFGFIR